MLIGIWRRSEKRIRKGSSQPPSATNHYRILNSIGIPRGTGAHSGSTANYGNVTLFHQRNRQFNRRSRRAGRKSRGNQLLPMVRWSRRDQGLGGFSGEHNSPRMLSQLREYSISLRVLLSRNSFSFRNMCNSVVLASFPVPAVKLPLSLP